MTVPKGGFGSVESRRSKTNNKIIGARARYWGPDGKRYTRTFGDKLSAQIWLVEERKLVDRSEWRPPNQREVVRKLTLSAWASEYVESRTLAPATRRNYVRWLAVYVEPSIGRNYLLYGIARTHLVALAKTVPATSLTDYWFVLQVLDSLHDPMNRPSAEQPATSSPPVHYAAARAAITALCAFDLDNRAVLSIRDVLDREWENNPEHTSHPALDRA
ncbi:hypothetical protein JOE63_002860 [Cellulosimicrobium cellulans]|uniref:hypothetical protein n=1 Tax=Cellulosimicrobium cellulans TaxID=1710 RepID=UPI00195C2062|nr:hypothetical protein [Cellulosimicrobium cellulans]MBM7820383.1 hypothetical protein [Cellulosimicrobium cellulans]